MNQQTIAIIIHRAEGRSDDAYWRPGQSKAFSGEDALTQACGALALAAKAIDHPGYDKFDLELIRADGSRTQSRIDLHKGEQFLDVLAALDA